jgi:hypothetical protein
VPSIARNPLHHSDLQNSYLNHPLLAVNVDLEPGDRTRLHTEVTQANKGKKATAS